MAGEIDYSELVRQAMEVARQTSPPLIPSPQGFNMQRPLPKIESLGPRRGSFGMPLGGGELFGGGQMPSQDDPQRGFFGGYRGQF